MPNITTTNVDLGDVILADVEFQNAPLTFPAADDYVEGTILARKRVADAVTVTGVYSVGDGTVTAVTVAAGQVVPIAGDYTLEVTEARASGGVFNLADPNGAIVATGLVMDAGAGTATTFVAAGLEFTITDGATDFIVGDSFTLTVAADGSMVIYAEAGAGGAQIPSAVLTYDVSAAAAGDVSIRALVSGRVRREHLVIDAGGTVTDAIVDQLRDYSIIAETVTELNILDNQ